ncbi:hypothetical protein HPP92_024124 [Vanilla planifolia]|uniref:UDP-N-acetylmuramate dehydrogenase n=1 Tax=Vanilla planifolia TaxID=51239 RepID=A0A835PMG0_VANPL|nr:hypothetical protein HPP92_024422 [Vanilla planifolia]KAG0456336.1 hypothetical protein HPP92_024124 [Vanilla planifolia]
MLLSTEMALRNLWPLLSITPSAAHPSPSVASHAASNRLLFPPLTTEDTPASILDIERATLRNRKLLRDLSTFSIGGPCSLFLEVHSPAQLLSAARLARARSLPLLVLGRGSNCLFSDRGFDGLVVLNRSPSASAEPIGPTGRVRAWCGYPFNRLGVQTAAEGWGGLEFAGGIPGTVGGAAFMNAGADGQETADVVETVEVVTREGEVKLLGREDVSFGYRWSSMQEMKELAAILAVTFRLHPSTAARNRQRMFLDRRRKTQPIGDRSAGSVFRNPVGMGVTAGELIDIAGLKGFEIGGAKVSELHANFIVNKGGATAKDVLALIGYIKDRVDRLFGIQLKEEIRYVPYDHNSA